MGVDESVKESKLPDENPVLYCRPIKKNEEVFLEVRGFCFPW